MAFSLSENRIRRRVFRRRRTERSEGHGADESRRSVYGRRSERRSAMGRTAELDTQASRYRPVLVLRGKSGVGTGK